MYLLPVKTGNDFRDRQNKTYNVPVTILVDARSFGGKSGRQGTERAINLNKITKHNVILYFNLYPAGFLN